MKKKPKSKPTKKNKEKKSTKKGRGRGQLEQENTRKKKRERNPSQTTAWEIRDRISSATPLQVLGGDAVFVATNAHVVMTYFE